MSAIAGIVDMVYGESTEKQMLRGMDRRGGECRVSCREPGVLLLASSSGAGETAKQTERYAVFFDGRLTHTAQLCRELRALGQPLRDQSQPSLILAAYSQWGEQCPERLSGAFAFAVWDTRKHRLFLARDRMGIRPLFYAKTREGFLFGSEQKILLCAPGMPAQLDARGLGELLLLGPGRTPGSAVFYGMSQLEPGCCGVYGDRRWQMRHYWTLQDREHREGLEETADHVRQLLLDSVREQAVPGALLSGGLDSSILTSLCSRFCPGEMVDTYSVDYEQNDRYFVPDGFQPDADGAYIEIMHRMLHTRHHRVLLTPEQLADSLEPSTLARDLPGMADVDGSLLLFCRQVREHSRAVLSGECADELFGGYPWFRSPHTGFPWAGHMPQRLELLRQDMVRSMPGEEFVRQQYADARARCDLLPGCPPEEAEAKRMMQLNLWWFMQTLLERNDRMSTDCGLEVRVPFCDYRLAEYLYGVPAALRDAGGREKGLLRYAVRDLLPEKVLNRKKSPYPKTWDPGYETLVRQRLEAVLADAGSPLLQIVDIQAVRRLLETPMDRPWYGQLMRRPQVLAYLLQLNFWLQEYRVQLI